jgi:hypothetical protein
MWALASSSPAIVPDEISSVHAAIEVSPSALWQMSPLLVAAGATVAKIIHSKTEIVNVAIVLETDVKSTSSN